MDRLTTFLFNSGALMKWRSQIMGRDIDWKMQMESDARELTRIAWTRQYGEENVDIYEYERGNNPPNYTDWFEERGLKSKFFLKGKRRLFENE